MHPARRPDAGSRRVRHGRADQAARAVEDDPDHLPDRDLEGGAARLPRLLRGCRRLPLQAVRPGSASFQGLGLHRAAPEDGGAEAPGRAPAGARRRRGAAGQRGPLPPARGRDAADRVGSRPRRPRDVLQPPLVRVHRPVRGTGRRERLDAGRAPRRPPRRGCETRRDAHLRQGLRGRVPLPRSGRDVPLASRPGCPDPRRGRRDRVLDRHGNRHPRSQADPAGAAVPARSGRAARHVAPLHRHARGGRTRGGPRGRRLGRRAHRRRRGRAPGGAGARGRTEDRLRRGAAASATRRTSRAPSPR